MKRREEIEAQEQENLLGARNVEQEKIQVGIAKLLEIAIPCSISIEHVGTPGCKRSKTARSAL